MADGMDIQVEGLPELKRQFSALSDKMQRSALRSSLREASKPMLQEAQARVPVRTGHLKRSLGIASSGRKTNVQALIGPRKKFRAFYAHIVELGSSKMRARPFLRPAFDASKDKVIKAFAGALGEKIDQVAARARRVNG